MSQELNQSQSTEVTETKETKRKRLEKLASQIFTGKPSLIYSYVLMTDYPITNKKTGITTYKSEKFVTSLQIIDDSRFNVLLTQENKDKASITLELNFDNNTYRIKGQEIKGVKTKLEDLENQLLRSFSKVDFKSLIYRNYNLNQVMGLFLFSLNINEDKTDTMLDAGVKEMEYDYITLYTFLTDILPWLNKHKHESNYHSFWLDVYEKLAENEVIKNA